MRRPSFVVLLGAVLVGAGTAQHEPEEVHVGEGLELSSSLRQPRKLRVHQLKVEEEDPSDVKDFWENFIDPVLASVRGLSMSMPTSAPSEAPRTQRPTNMMVTPRPSPRPIKTLDPTRAPQTKRPSSPRPSDKPSNVPQTSRPSRSPVTARPTNPPKTKRPTSKPTPAITTPRPTNVPTEAPVAPPSNTPVTRRPSKAPTTTTRRPTRQPSPAPVVETKGPVIVTKRPTRQPTEAPVRPPTKQPITPSPTRRPTRRPTQAPVRAPTRDPTRAPIRAPTRAPTDAPVTAPATCNINLATRCEECENLVAIDPLCQGVPTEITMRFVGGSCQDSETAQDIACFDFGTISQEAGTQAYIVVQFRQTVYFSGFVRVGQDYVISSPNGAPLGPTQSIVVYRSEDLSPNNVLQSLVYVGDCSEPLRLKSRFGASQVVGFTVNGESTNAFEDLTVSQVIRVPPTSASSVQLVSLATQSNLRTFNLTDTVAGTDLQIGQSTVFSFDITIDVTRPREYNFVSAVSARPTGGASTNTCSSVSLYSFRTPDLTIQSAAAEVVETKAMPAKTGKQGK